MIVSTMRQRTATCLLLICLTGCERLPSVYDGTAADRLREPAALHADALASGDIDAAQATGYDLIQDMRAFFKW